MTKKIAVVGTGTMGNGIAHVFALSGYTVSLIGVSNELVENALQTISANLERQVKKELISSEVREQTLSNIHSFTSIADGVKDAELVVEAVFEDIETKKNIFKALDEFSSPSAILASNTSSISITKLGSFTSRPDKVIGMHFMNPVPVMRLVEVIRGYSTSDETTKLVMETALKLEKVPVEVNDYSGFVANRILMPMINEAVFTLFENVAGVEEIDTVMKLGMGHPMGPLQLADFIGLDVCYAILNVMHDDFKNPKYAPCPLLAKMVEAGNIGVKSGKGFYKYTLGEKELKVAERFMR